MPRSGLAYVVQLYASTQRMLALFFSLYHSQEGAGTSSFLCSLCTTVRELHPAFFKKVIRSKSIVRRGALGEGSPVAVRRAMSTRCEVTTTDPPLNFSDIGGLTFCHDPSFISFATAARPPSCERKKKAEMHSFEVL